jgi:uroporphyrin-III C-methyltransferase/precorrin-2 dehydrogenase/sirohydrochlorin ferrochelatase
MYLPLLFRSSGMRCLIVGGGEVAWHKVEILSAADCAITVIAPQVHGGIQSEIKNGRVNWIERKFRDGDCIGYRLVVAATGNRPLNLAVSEEAKSLCIPVNVVDDPQLCTFTFPAIWREEPLTISVGTEGTAPFMASAIRDRLAAYTAPLASWVKTAAKFRALVRSEVRDRNEKKLLYQKFVDVVRPGDPPAPPESGKLADWIEWIDRVKGQAE